MTNPQTIRDLQDVATGRRVPKARLAEHVQAGLILLDVDDKPTLTIAGNQYMRGQ